MRTSRRDAPAACDPDVQDGDGGTQRELSCGRRRGLDGADAACEPGVVAELDVRRRDEEHSLLLGHVSIL